MSEALVFDQIIDLFPVLSLPVGPVFISVGWKMILFLQFRISVLMIVWHIFGAMGTGFRHIIAKHFQKFIPDLIIMIVRPCQGLLPDFRVKILSVPGNFQKPCLVVNSADPVNDIIRRHSQPFQQFFCTDLYTVAEAHTFDICRLLYGAGNNTHGISIIQQPCIGTYLFHITGDIQHDRNGAQAAEQAAHSQSIGDGLIQAIFFRYLEIRYNKRIIFPYGDSVDDIIRIAQRFLSVMVNLHAGVVSQVLVQAPKHSFRLAEPLFIDVEQSEPGFGKGWCAHAVP